ncbi:hypothetical protein Tco_1279931, partial [Tanacetum coccineum]
VWDVLKKDEVVRNAGSVKKRSTQVSKIPEALDSNLDHPDLDAMENPEMTRDDAPQRNIYPF